MTLYLIFGNKSKKLLADESLNLDTSSIHNVCLCYNICVWKAIEISHHVNALKC